MSPLVSRALVVHNGGDVGLAVAFAAQLHGAGLNVGVLEVPQELVPQRKRFERYGAAFTAVLKRTAIEFALFVHSAPTYGACLFCKRPQILGGEAMHGAFSLGYIGLGERSVALVCGQPCCGMSNGGIFMDPEVVKVAAPFRWECVTHTRHVDLSVDVVAERLWGRMDTLVVMPASTFDPHRFAETVADVEREVPPPPFHVPAGLPTLRLDPALMRELERQTARNPTAQVDILQECGMFAHDAFTLYQVDPSTTLSRGLAFLGKGQGPDLIARLSRALHKQRRPRMLATLNRWIADQNPHPHEEVRESSGA